MKATDKLFAGSIPALYDRYLGPWLFEPYAIDLGGRLARLREGRVLETAAGTGIATRALRRILPEAVEIVATDLNQPMLDHAASVETLSNVTWRHADALALPFADASFDAVVCQFGVMFFPDKRAAYAEARRVLKPGGTFLFNVWDRIEANEVSDIVSQAVAELFPDDPPRFLARTPHGHHDLDAIRGELRAAGFERIETETVAKVSHVASHRDPAIGFVQGSPLRNEIEARAPGRVGEATEAAASALAARLGSGVIESRMRAHVIAARR